MCFLSFLYVVKQVDHQLHLNFVINLYIVIQILNGLSNHSFETRLIRHAGDIVLIDL